MRAHPGGGPCRDAPRSACESRFRRQRLAALGAAAQVARRRTRRANRPACVKLGEISPLDRWVTSYRQRYLACIRPVEIDDPRYPSFADSSGSLIYEDGHSDEWLFSRPRVCCALSIAETWVLRPSRVATAPPTTGWRVSTRIPRCQSVGPTRPAPMQFGSQARRPKPSGPAEGEPGY